MDAIPFLSEEDFLLTGVADHRKVLARYPGDPLVETENKEVALLVYLSQDIPLSLLFATGAKNEPLLIGKDLTGNHGQ